MRQRGQRDPLAATGACVWHARREGQGRRSSDGKDRGICRFILKAIEKQPNPTLAKLREMLAARCVTTSIATLWRWRHRRQAARCQADHHHELSPTADRPRAPLRHDRRCVRTQGGGHRARSHADGRPSVQSELEYVFTGQSAETSVGIVRKGGAVGRVGVPHYDIIPGAQPMSFDNVSVAGGSAPVCAYIKQATMRA